MNFGYIDENYKEISENISRATLLAGRDEEPQMLVSVKSADIEEIEYLVKAHGIKIVGENRVGQLLERYERYKEMNLDVHFIGSLQTNKVKHVIDKVSLIHSLDRIELAREIDKRAKKLGIVMDVLVEINSGREENKGGVLPEDAEAFCNEIASFSSIRLRGFMTMAPKCEKIEEYRKFFAETYQNALDIWQKKLDNIGGTPILSMGMSGSFEAAIMEGATIVRVGGALFRA